jgi:membrane-associated protein
MPIADRVLDAVAGLGTPWLHLAGAGLAFGETAVFLDLLVPGEVGMVIIGAAADRRGIALVPVILVVALGAMLGDSASYAVGRYAGRPLLCRWDWIRRHAEPGMARAERFVERRSGQAIFAARFVGAVRAIAPLVAGIERMEFRRFLVWNAAASLAWATLTITLGYLVGEHVASALDRAGWLVSVVAVVALGIVGVRRWRRIQRTGHSVPAS